VAHGAYADSDGVTAALPHPGAFGVCLAGSCRHAPSSEWTSENVCPTSSAIALLVVHSLRPRPWRRREDVASAPASGGDRRR
jgi:hypothetical protein